MAPLHEPWRVGDKEALRYRCNRASCGCTPDAGALCWVQFFVGAGWIRANFAREDPSSEMYGVSCLCVGDSDAAAKLPSVVCAA